MSGRPTEPDVEVELFRSDDYVHAGRLPLLPLLRGVFEPMVGRPLLDAVFELSFLPLTDDTPVTGSPSVVNLRGSHGYVRVRITRNGTDLYQHPHPLREVVGRPLQVLLGERHPEVGHWGFGIRGPGLEHVKLVRPAPQATGRTDITVGGPRRRAFRIEEIPEPDPPKATLAELGVNVPAEAGAGVPLGVVLGEPVHTALVRTEQFSGEVEEGGFLIGQVYLDGNDPDGGRLVRVTAAVPAQRTGASLLHFTFTGESYLRIGEALAERGRGESLVGWYHTHLFAATERFGLSTTDVELHLSTFRRPWQMAALVNIGRRDGERVLRLYRRTEDDSLTLAPYWVEDA